MRFLVTGASGQLGAYLLRHLARQGDPVVAWSGSRTADLFGFPLRAVDLTDRDAVATAFRAAAPTVVIHAAARSTIIDCFRDPLAAQRVNVEGTAHLAELAARAKARLLLVSTDLVFDGERGSYRERDAVSPQTTYGRSKAAAEGPVLASPGGVVVRTGLLLGPTLIGRPTVFDGLVSALRERRPCPLYDDEWRTPLGLSAAAAGLVAIARSDYSGVLHMGGPERVTRFEMGARLAADLKCDPTGLIPTTRSDPVFKEPRPRDTSLDSTLWRGLFPTQPWPVWDELREDMRGA